MPTVAELSRLSPVELSRIGDWVGVKENKLQMPLRYADAKTESTLLVKLELRESLAHAAGAAPDPAASWAQLARHFLDREEGKKRAQTIFATVEASAPVVADAVLPIAWSLPEPTVDPKGGDEDDSSSAGSSSDGRDSCHEVDSDQLQWFLSSGKRGHLHLANLAADKPWVTLCGRCLRNPSPGVGT